MSESSTHVPEEFQAAVASIAGTSLRPDLRLTEIPAPAKLAPYAYAVAADVKPTSHGDSQLGTGRMVLLYDPQEPDAWGGRFRIVSFAQAPLEPDIGLDPFLADVAWSWLIDHLDEHNANYVTASGTVTKIISTGFGELADQGDGAQLELRASWTPLDSEIGRHLSGWGDLLCMLAGLPPHAEGVTALPKRKERG